MGNQWGNLVEADKTGEQDHPDRNETFPTISEALSISDKTSKSPMPKLRKPDQKLIKRKLKTAKKQGKFTCDADTMKTSEIDDLLSGHENTKLIKPNDTVISADHDCKL